MKEKWNLSSQVQENDALTPWRPCHGTHSAVVRFFQNGFAHPPAPFLPPDSANQMSEARKGQLPSLRQAMRIHCKNMCTFTKAEHQRKCVRPSQESSVILQKIVFLNSGKYRTDLSPPHEASLLPEHDHATHHTCSTKEWLRA